MKQAAVRAEQQGRARRAEQERTRHGDWEQLPRVRQRELVLTLAGMVVKRVSQGQATQEEESGESTSQD